MRWFHRHYVTRTLLSQFSGLCRTLWDEKLKVKSGEMDCWCVSQAEPQSEQCTVTHSFLMLFPGSLHLNLHINDVLTQTATSGVRVSLETRATTQTYLRHLTSITVPTMQHCPVWFLLSPSPLQCPFLFLKPYLNDRLFVPSSCQCYNTILLNHLLLVEETQMGKS